MLRLKTVEGQRGKDRSDDRPKGFRGITFVPFPTGIAVADFGGIVGFRIEHETDGADNTAGFTKGNRPGSRETAMIQTADIADISPGVGKAPVRLPEDKAGDLRVRGVGIDIAGIRHAKRTENQTIRPQDRKGRKINGRSKVFAAGAGQMPGPSETEHLKNRLSGNKGRPAFVP